MTEPSVERLPVVGVMGSGRDAQTERATALGRWLALEGVHLLTGGGRGVMASVSRGFTSVPGRRGLVIGILPAAPDDVTRAPHGYPNPWIEIAIRTQLPIRGERGDEPMSRNHVNVLSSDVVIALAGTEGTASEVRLALRYGRPVIAYLETGEEIAGGPAEVPVTDSLDEVKAFVRANLGLPA